MMEKEKTMIAVIGCVKETVSVKLLPPKEDERQQEGFGGYGYPGPYGMAPPQEMPQEEPEEEDDEITVKDAVTISLSIWLPGDMILNLYRR